MKRFLLLLALAAFTVSFAQEDAPSLVFDQVVLDVLPGKMTEFSQKITEHNKQFHASEPTTVRVYNVRAGTDTGKFIWNMGPCTFEDMKNFDDSSEHTQHWVDHVMPTLKEMTGGTYWKYHPEYSNIQNDFNLNLLYISFYDIKREMGSFDKLKPIIEKFTAVYRQDYKDDSYGVYTNMMGSTKEGRDLAIVSFMDDITAMDDDNPDFPDKYNAMHGDGSFERDLQVWMDYTIATESEMWVFIPELSTGAQQVIATDRQ